MLPIGIHKNKKITVVIECVDPASLDSGGVSPVSVMLDDSCATLSGYASRGVLGAIINHQNF